MKTQLARHEVVPHWHFLARFLSVGCLLVCLPGLRAGGSGLNVLVIANRASSNSLELANYYRLQRDIPPGNVLHIDWAGGNVEWTLNDFNTFLLTPILDYLAVSPRSEQIQYAVLSMDIPYRVTGSRANSTTSALFYGFKDGTKYLSNSYAASEARFAEAPPDVAPGHSLLATMLTAASLEQAKALVDQGVAADGTFVAKSAWLEKSGDPDRNRRHTRFDNAIFNARLCSGYSLLRTNNTVPPLAEGLLGWQTGRATFSIPDQPFVPGAIADSLTSFGGQIFESSGQTSLLEFIHAGAAGSYGTVTEPQLDLKKFPDPMVYYYQARGFSLAEAYYQAVQVPLEGLIVAEPLSAPYRRSVSNDWQGLEPNAILQGTTNLSVAIYQNDPSIHVDRVDLFVDGIWHETLTNIPPLPGNRLNVSLNGHAVTYQVAPGDSLGSIASGLAAVLNDPTNRTYTKVEAAAYGDRIELQYLDPMMPPGTFEFVDGDSAASAPRQYLAVFQPYRLPARIRPLGWSTEGAFELAITENLGRGYRVEASADLATWVPIHTNAAGGPMSIQDSQSASFSTRFYRLKFLEDYSPTTIDPLGLNAEAQFMISVTAAPDAPCIVQASHNLREWSDIATNLSGGTWGFTDLQAPGFARRYYRTRSADTNDYTPLTVVGQTSAGANVIQVQSEPRGNTTVWASTNSTDWFPVYTDDGNVFGPQLETTSSSGTNSALSTFLMAAKPEFLKTTAHGRRKFLVDDLDQAGASLSLSVTLTNGEVHTISRTNTGLSNLEFLEGFADALNAASELQGADGLVAEDVLAEPFGAASFALRARAPGLPASTLQVQSEASAGGSISPSGTVSLQENLSDLRSRNNLCVVAGLTQADMVFPLNTGSLPDGYHTLSIVAFEGSHVYSQTLSHLPVIVANSALQATLETAEPGSTLAVDDTVDLVVTANTNSVAEILLLTTGGVYAGTTNQPAASFEVPGTDLGVGTHRFHALVTTTNGLSYRTEALDVTFVR